MSELINANLSVEENHVKVVEKKQRNSSIELLRVILMLVIVMCHCSASIMSVQVNNNLNKWFLQLTNLSNLMVDIFVLISGYYICKLKFSFKKVLIILLQVVFYSVGSYVFCVAIKNQTFSTKSLLLSFIPTITRSYWFVTAYVTLYLLSPFINKLLGVITQLQHLLLIAVIGVIYSIIPTFTTFYQDGMDIFVLILLYCIGAYLRLYPNSKLLQKKSVVLLTCLGALTYFGSVIGLNVVGLKFEIFAQHPCYFLTKHSPITIVFAIGIFALFTKWNFYSKFVNVLGGATFGVYLLHNNGYFRQWLRFDLFKFNAYSESNKFIPYVILATIIIFVFCIIVELIRKYTIEKGTKKLLDKVFDKDKKDV